MTNPSLDSVLSLSINMQLRFEKFQLKIKQDLALLGITGVFGHSGSGKSTLLRAIAGLETQIDGSITLNDITLINSKTKHFIKPERRNIGLVFQDSRLFPHLTVVDNLLFAAKRCQNKQLDFNEIIQLTELDNLLHKPVDELSGGQKQRVALARAILAEPKLLLLDEPLSALDRQAKTRLLKLILKVQSKLKLPMLYVSHSLDELQQVCDKLLVLSQGNVTGYDGIHSMIHQLNYTGQNNSHNNINSGTQGNTQETHSQSTDLILQQTSLSLPIKTVDNGHGLAVLALNAQDEVYLPTLADYATGATLRCFILATDISISLTEPVNSSIVNHLLAKIKTIHMQNNKVFITAYCPKANGEQSFFLLK